jgi:Na+:H+ antiporter, NhaA family
MKTIQNTFSNFFKLESSSSIILFISALAAIFFANSALKDLYFNVLNSLAGISVGSFSLTKPIILWINDGLMAIFFFVIGLEIKRELMAGELQSWKKSALPVFAAIGGMIIPVLLFLIIHPTSEGLRGWGIPMATDIAFSLGILKLLGNRVPLSLKIFLTAFAIIDDLGAVMVIAIFYSAKIYWSYVLISLIIYAGLIILSFMKLNARYLYIAAGIAIWYLFLKSGIHPTIAGVLMAFVIPVNRKIGKLKFAKELKSIAKSFKESKSPDVFLNHPQLDAVNRAECLVEKVQPYLQHLEHKMHSWVAFFIMPVFALANAGVELFNTQSSGINPIAWHLGLALLFGKVGGISLFSYLSLRFKLASLPEGVNMKMIIGVSFLGAVGFTMALFINTLAFSDPLYINAGKIGIIVSSLVAGISGYFILKRVLPQS